VNEGCHIEEEIEKYNRKIEYNSNMIKELEVKIEILNKEKEDQKIKYLEQERVDQLKFDQLNKKYKDLVKQSQEYQIVEDLRENEFAITQMQILNENKEKENLEMY
jgi:hypothetical protein